MDFNFGGRAGKFGKGYCIIPDEDADLQITHETLHALVNDGNGVVNTVFTEALFDVLCGREETGLWFAQETFAEIKQFME